MSPTPRTRTRAAALRMRMLRQSNELPGWWTMLQLALAVAFFCYIAYALMSDDAPGGGDPAAGARNLGKGVVSTGGASTPRRVVTPSSEPVSTNPTDLPTTSADPTTSSPASTVDVGPVVTLLDAGGSSVQVPEAALKVAQQAMAGAFDPAKLAGVPLADGVTVATTGQPYPKAVLGPVSVLSAAGEDITFTATGDTDGAGRFMRAVQARVLLQGGAWKYTTAAR